MKQNPKIAAVLLFILAGIAYSQPKTFNPGDVNYKKIVISVAGADSVIVLPDKFLKFGTLTLYSDSTEVDPANYSIDYRYGKVRLKDSFVKDIVTSGKPERLQLIITYKNFPFDIPDSYSKFEILNKLDTLGGDTVKVAEIKSDFVEDIFAGTDLQKSGSIFRGLTIGNNRDLTLQSGFRLQLNGKLSSDIEITAALTDENTPIQPEGNTQKLQELDKVFVELRSTNITATLGDIDVNFTGSDYFNFSKKLQGAKGFANFGKTDLFLTGAISRGRFNSNSFNGIDGVQGPYRLVGADNEVNIVVIAGSEKVYLDGIVMTRGESNDYTIDYSNGQIKFSNRRLITNSSRIVVDFEYSDKKYSRSFIAGQTKTAVFNERLKLSFSYLRERDDPNKPIDFLLSDTDRTIISQAGDDKFKASRSGVVFVGADTSGKSLGSYIQRDTLINSQSFIKYLYAPGNDSALYQVTFSFVGAGKGDYNSLSTSAYTFAGIAQGSYLPIVFFPLPVAYQSADIGMELKLSKSVSLLVEGSGSDFDRNLLSDKDDSENKGGAFSASFLFSPKQLKLGNLNLGDIEFFFRQKVVNKLYNAVDRLNRIEYDRIWDIQDSLRLTESISELGLRFNPGKYLSINTNGGRISRGDKFNSTRGSVDLKFKGDSLELPSANYYVDYISSNDKNIDYGGKWIRQFGNLNYKLSPFTNKKLGKYNLVFEFGGEDKQIRSLNFDTAGIGSFRFYEFRPMLLISDLFKFDLSYRFNYRYDDVYNQGRLERQSNSYTSIVGLNLKDLSFLSASGDVTVYDRKYTPVFQQQGFSDSRTILVTSQSNIWFLERGLNANLFYKISSERTAKQEVVFIAVPIGQGNYKYLGDLNGNGLQDENEFVLTNYDGDYIKIIRPTDQLFPTTDLQSSVNVNIVPSRFITTSGNNVMNTILRNLTFDSYLSVAEKSKDPVQRNIYFLKFSTFQNDVNTITGAATVQQDIGIFENNDLFGIKLRFIQRRGFNQFFSGNERVLHVERTGRFRFSFTQDIALITDYVTEIDRNLAPGIQIRNWNINTEGVTSELVYKPIASIEAGFKVQLKKANDLFPTQPTKASINVQTLRMTYSFSGKGTLSSEISRNEAIISTDPAFVPFDLTKGLVIGKSYFWSLNFEYRISNFIQATINYYGRAENKSRVIHTGTAEVRAYF
ncbi:MAG: hypothetical protein K8I03_12665 [Ignavibacteria bacterium]|nr:hypothetical protein [Ignavibacteria bacterium]